MEQKTMTPQEALQLLYSLARTRNECADFHERCLIAYATLTKAIVPRLDPIDTTPTPDGPMAASIREQMTGGGA